MRWSPAAGAQRLPGGTAAGAFPVPVELPEKDAIDFKEALVFAWLGLLRWQGPHQPGLGDRGHARQRGWGGVAALLTPGWGSTGPNGVAGQGTGLLWDLPAGEGMRDALKRFEERAPEIVFEWHDAPTGARGWVVTTACAAARPGAAPACAWGWTSARWRAWPRPWRSSSP